MFNVLVALMLMEGGIQSVVERVLALYSNFAVAWFGAVVADLVVNKPLRLSPSGIEFKRAHLYDINPVGVGAMALSLIGSTMCFAGFFGAIAQAFSPVFGLAIAFAAAPGIAWMTRGAYYLARTPEPMGDGAERLCTICENMFEPHDMAYCPVYSGAICSLCCTLEARCHDACKSDASVSRQTAGLLRRLLPPNIAELASRRIVRFVLLYAIVAAIAGGLLTLVYLRQAGMSNDPAGVAAALRAVFVGLLILAGFAAWYVVLAQESQRAAEEETERQTSMLVDEIEAHRLTDQALERAREVAEAANLAKSRYIVGVSHEIRAPLSTISGYAQLLERDPAHGPDAARVIRRSTAHLVNLVDGLMDISRIENGSLRIARDRVALGEMLDQIVDMFRLQAAAKGLVFEHERVPGLPAHVFTDEKRLRQILINLVSNAIKYTPTGGAALTVRWRDPGGGVRGERHRHRHRARKSGTHLRAVRAHRRGGRPARHRARPHHLAAAGQYHGRRSLGRKPAGRRHQLSAFKMFFSEAPRPAARQGPGERLIGYAGPRRRILVTDDDAAHLDMVGALLAPLGFDLRFAESGTACLAAMAEAPADLVMLDIAMPGLDGWETARAIRARHGDGPVILMVSANVHDFQRTRREDDPHDDFLTKPFELETLLERIETLLDIVWTGGAA